MSAVRLEEGGFLSKELLLSSADLIEKVWPGYLQLFLGEVAAFQASPGVFQPYFVAAVSDRGVVGFSLLLSSMMSDSLNAISWVAVDEGFRHQKIGNRLVLACVEEARRRDKDVILTTTVPSFYEHQGFKIIDQFNGGKDFVMRREVRAVI